MLTELEITWDRLLRIWWSFLWRNLIATLGSMVIGGIMGFIIGLILSVFGIPVSAIKIVCMCVGFVLGLAISIIPLWLVLGKNFGSFRLVLVSDTGEAAQIPPLRP